MTNFFDLFVAHASDPTVRDDPAWADRQFPNLIAASPFHLWRPGDPIAEREERYLIGVATWCGYDMRLLDVLAESLSRNTLSAPAVDIFNTADCRQATDFARYIPGANGVLHTPVVGSWRDARFQSFAQGHSAREWLAGLFGFTSAEIVAFVQDWIKGQVSAP
jgi:hypothetical protein